MSAQARVLRNGLLSPWVCDYMAGVQELDHLRAQGLDLDLTPFEVHALGVAMAEQRGEGHGPAMDLVLSPAFLDALERVAREREAGEVQVQVQVQDHGLRPRGLREIVPEASRDGSHRAVDYPHPGPVGRAVQGEPADRNGENDRKRYWERITRDRADEDWS